MQYAMYCENGHRIDLVDPTTGEKYDPSDSEHNAMLMADYPDEVAAEFLLHTEPLPKFCADCGAKTMSKCDGCSAYIRYNDNRVHFVPSYCTECGVAFPWVTAALQELSRVTDEAEELTGEEKTALKRAYPELTKNTSKTSGAVETFKRYYAKFSPAAWNVIRTVLINILTDESKQGLGSLFHK